MLLKGDCGKGNGEWRMENGEYNVKMNWEIESFNTNFLECEIKFFSSDYQYSFIFLKRSALN